MKDPIRELVDAIRADGKPSLDWVVRYSRDGEEPVGHAWADSCDPMAMNELLCLAGNAGWSAISARIVFGWQPPASEPQPGWRRSDRWNPDWQTCRLHRAGRRYEWDAHLPSGLSDYWRERMMRDAEQKVIQMAYADHIAAAIRAACAEPPTLDVLLTHCRRAA